MAVSVSVRAVDACMHAPPLLSWPTKVREGGGGSFRASIPRHSSSTPSSAAGRFGPRSRSRSKEACLPALPAAERRPDVEVEAKVGILAGVEVDDVLDLLAAARDEPAMGVERRLVAEGEGGRGAPERGRGTGDGRSSSVLLPPP